MKKIALLALPLLAATAVQAQTTEGDWNKKPYVNVSYTHEMKVDPDMIYIGFVIDESVSNGKNKLADMEKNMLAGMKEIGVDTDKDLAVTDASSSKKSNKWRKDDTYKKKSYQVIAHDAETASVIFDMLNSVGIPQADVTKITSSKLSEYNSEARQKAMQGAKKKADELATAIGQTIGAALTIDDYNSVPYADEMLQGRVMGLSVSSKAGYVSADSAPVEFQKIEIRYSVNVRFELK